MVQTPRETCSIPYSIRDWGLKYLPIAFLTFGHLTVVQKQPLAYIIKSAVHISVENREVVIRFLIVGSAVLHEWVHNGLPTHYRSRGSGSSSDQALSDSSSARTGGSGSPPYRPEWSSSVSQPGFLYYIVDFFPKQRSTNQFNILSNALCHSVYAVEHREGSLQTTWRPALLGNSR